VRPTVSTAGERELIERITRRLGRALPPFVRLGIGDDAAVIRPERGAEDVLTTDSLIEGVHFRREWTSAAAIGHKALAVNLSDIAAMGATPRACLLSLAAPSDFPLADFDELIDGFASLATAAACPLIGGNLTRSPGPLVVDVTAVGTVRPRRLLRRRGAAPGHRLYVTGEVGSAAAGLEILRAGKSRADLTGPEAQCVARHDTPVPRLRFAAIVAKTAAASACIDLSDGLADAARRLAEAAEAGVTLAASALPLNPAARSCFEQQGLEPAMAAILGGEDYELAFAVAPRQERRFRAAARRCSDLAVTHVGTFVTERGTWLDIGSRHVDVPEPAFSHFRA
jgi:thiamine-monophosphate kinase